MKTRHLCPKEDMRTSECSYCRYICLLKADGDANKYNELRKTEQEHCSKVQGGAKSETLKLIGDALPSQNNLERKVLPCARRTTF